MATAQAPQPQPHSQPPAEHARARQVERILERVETLPTLSPVAARLLSLGASDGVPINDVVRIIESDPTLSIKLVGLCRKADRGLGDRITTVRRAVLMLGLDAVRAVALSVAAYELMSRKAEVRALDSDLAGESHVNPDESAFDRMGFWKHSIGVACAAELIAEAHPRLKVAPEEAFLAGLLHGVGKIVLEWILPRSYDKVVRLAARRACDSAQVERAILGLDNHGAGKRVAGHWSMPEPIARVIWLHAQPPQTLTDTTPDRSLIACVALAKGITRGLHLGFSGDFGPAPDPERLALDLGFDPAVVKKVSGPLHAAVADRMRVLGIDGGSPPELLLESLSAANRQLSALNVVLHGRSREAAVMRRTLEAMNQFLLTPRTHESIHSACTGLLRSARAAMTEGFFALLFQEAPGAPWLLLSGDGEDPDTEFRNVELPPGKWGSDISLSDLVTAGSVKVGVLGLLPWLSEYLADAPDLRTLSLMPVLTPRKGEPGPGALLIHDRDLESIPRLCQDTLAGAWSGALSAATLLDRARRAQDQLAESARALAAMQERLAEKESMARLGEVTRGAAHEMNNPLTVIQGQAQMLRLRLGEDPGAVSASAIAAAAGQLSDLVTSLHELATPPSPKPQRTEAWRLVQDALAEAEQKVGASLEAILEGDALGRTVSTDPALAKSVIVELLVNAAKNGKTPVTIRCEVDTGAGATAQFMSDQGREAGVLIRVRDHGSGFSARALHHAFDPFFSERAAGRGRGLGLTKARRTTEALGGTITLENAPGGGACVLLALPREIPARLLMPQPEGLPAAA